MVIALGEQALLGLTHLALALPFPCGEIKSSFSQSNGFGSHFHQLVLSDILDGPLERKLDCRSQSLAFVTAGSAMIGDVLGFGRIDRQVFRPGVFPHDHAFVHFLARTHEQFAPGLNVTQSIGHGLTLFHGNQSAGATRANVSGIRAVFLEQMRHNFKNSSLLLFFLTLIVNLIHHTKENILILSQH